MDTAPANDPAHWVQWRQLLDGVARRRFSLVLLFKLDRAFRSVKHMHDTLAAWELVGVSFKSLREQWRDPLQRKSSGPIYWSGG